MADETNDIPELRRITGAAKYVRATLKVVFWFITDRRVYGLENLPPDGPFIIVSNHLSRFDPPLGFVSVDRPTLTGFAGDTYRRHLYSRLFLEAAGVIWVNRGHTDRATMRAALNALKQGAILGIAPEGTRSPTGALIKGKTGAAFLASRADVPLVPAAITNTEKLGAAMKRLRRIPITLTFGQPFTLSPLADIPGSQRLEIWTDEIMCRLAAHLPENYRGVYAEHPRLKELLAR
ncbi:MAG: 1-acyl-sn-glycerol-3-phosphate acyltransferase [Chloroflexi bacterium]|nr:1-acyl-sn-glycerol-3-phosphate acyltransferase [Chloroflexota bacterium]